jgi:NADH:ubiquinone oxidoreductase subunit 5 (subunit L)/multisubunit Na+/H+ antiporter MnhA subunit
MFAHGIMTGLLFSSAGYIYDRTHTKMIPELGGLSKIMPVASGYFIVAALAGIGVPCLASFWAELLVFIASFKVYPVRGALAICALVVSALFMLRVVQRTFYGVKNERFAHLQDVAVLADDHVLGRDPDLGGDLRVVRELSALAVDRHEPPRPNQREHEAELLGRRVTARVHPRRRQVEDVGPRPVQTVDHPVDRRLVPGDEARR